MSSRGIDVGGNEGWDIVQTMIRSMDEVKVEVKRDLKLGNKGELNNFEMVKGINIV